MEVTTRKIELLGTISVYDCDSILVYNTETFKDPDIYNLLQIDEVNAELISNPTLSRIESIYNTLLDIDEFEVLPTSEISEDYKKFKFDNTIGLIKGEGFDIIIPLKSGKPLGYIKLVSPCGYYKHTRTNSYKVYQDYSMREINIILYTSEKESEVKVDFEIFIVTSVNKDDNPDILGEDLYKYSSAKDLLNNEPKSGVYSTKVGSDKSIVTDTTVFKNSIGSKLGIYKNLVLDSIYKGFEHTQVGFYKGDIVLYIWNSDCEYSIFSLTKTLNDLFGDISSPLRPLSYTVATKEFNNEIHKIPIHKGKEDYNHVIKYFSGRYALISIGGLSEYYFDTITREWLSGNYILDPTDIYERIIPISRKSWSSIKRCIDEVPEVSNSYVDGIFTDTLIRKHGDWLVFSNSENYYYTYTNMSRAIRVGHEESDPMIINNQVLMTVDDYIIYDSPGYYITPTLKRRMPNSDNWKLQTKSSRILGGMNMKDILTKSILSSFRRNVLPTKEFELIGALGGIIFYRAEKNIINYL